MADRVLIIGGGLAGLAAATALAPRGLRVTLVESKGRLGGHAHSWDDLGLDVAAERARFAEYAEYFGVRSEEV